MADKDRNPGQPQAAAVPDAIQWHEGMLLTPQHFQQAGLRAETLLSYQLSLAAPHHWGIARLAIDSAALVGGAYRVQDLEAVLPDGTLVSYGGSDSGGLEVLLEPSQEEMKSAPVTVWLAIAARELGGTSVGGDLARYDSHEGLATVDENTGESEIRIPRLKPRLRLMLGDRPPAKYVSMPLAQISYANETYALTTFVPPQLRVGLESRLGQICLQLATRVRETAAFLSEQSSSSGALGQSGRSLASENDQQIRALVAGLPVFEALLTSGRAHPFQLYLGLCGIVGQVAGVGGSTLPPQLPPYDHDNALVSFDRAARFILTMVDRVQLNYAVLPFRFSNAVFSLQVEPQWIGETFTLGVRGGRGVREADVVDWMDGALIGSAVLAQSMRERRVLGPVRQRIDRDEDLDLVAPRGVMLFSVVADPEFIEKRGSLTIFNTSANAEKGRPAEIVLYIHKNDHEEQGAGNGGRS